jgi:hypothetical protein
MLVRMRVRGPWIRPDSSSKRGDLPSASGYALSMNALAAIKYCYAIKIAINRGIVRLNVVPVHVAYGGDHIQQ